MHKPTDNQTHLKIPILLLSTEKMIFYLLYNNSKEFFHGSNTIKNEGIKTTQKLFTFNIKMEPEIIQQNPNRFLKIILTQFGDSFINSNNPVIKEEKIEKKSDKSATHFPVELFDYCLPFKPQEINRPKYITIDEGLEDASKAFISNMKSAEFIEIKERDHGRQTANRLCTLCRGHWEDLGIEKLCGCNFCEICLRKVLSTGICEACRKTFDRRIVQKYLNLFT